MPTTIALSRRAAHRSEWWTALLASLKTADFAAVSIVALTGLTIAIGAAILFPLPDALAAAIATTF